ncbi:Protein kinase C-like 3 [Eumeta japonica]|uniref:Protein kinase C-like 3 n=1 Tax=Eumeta variegata TaxID=151549 RepID=A0A4C1XKG4_EUMVA|nr:Protein kinase C-like 3 [Eumeta japonica]
MTITCDCEATPAFQLKAFSQRGEKVEVSHYRVNVNRFRARLSVVCVTDKLTGELKCDGWPEVKVALAPVGPLRPNATENNLQQIVSEIVVSALRSTNLQFNLSQYPTCPRLRRYHETPGRMLPLHYDSMLHGDRQLYTSTPNSTGSTIAQLIGEKRLLVKVVGAKDLGGKQGCKSPYCVVEMDEPPQRNQTGVKKDTTSPVWDEHFLFDLSPDTAELLFEIYDRTGPPTPGSQHRFLGLGLVGIDELLAAPSQRQQIGLQKRPMENEDVTGVLTVEFLFIEGADIPDMGSRPFKIKESLRTVSPTGHLTTTTKTTFQQNSHEKTQLTESALRELENSPATAANKSTLIIHSVQRVELTESGKFIEVERGEPIAEEAIDNNLDECETNQSVTPSQSPAKLARISENGSRVGDAQQGDYVKIPEQSNEVPPERIPRQKKKRDFFGTIKRRLGRSRTRGQSLDLPDSDVDNQLRMRSISAERNHHDPAMTIANRNVYSAGASPAQSGDESRTSRSTASARTFIHEASTLVLETIEAGIKKHYLVPLAIAQRSRWRRKGVKLHIYNEHTFIAKHLSGGTVCKVCDKTVARRIGKQGYECRDCHLACHKHCHVKVPSTCPQSTVHNMELIFRDLSKAFDCVYHETLIGKLRHYGVTGRALDLLKSYLSNRVQRVDVNVRNKELEFDNSTVFLGITLDNKLQWGPHISKLAKRLSSAAYAVKKMRNLSDVETARLVYFGCFHSLMSYGILLWGNAADIHRIFVLQKRARYTSGLGTRRVGEIHKVAYLNTRTPSTIKTYAGDHDDPAGSSDRPRHGYTAIMVYDTRYKAKIFQPRRFLKFDSASLRTLEMRWVLRSPIFSPSPLRSYFTPLRRLRDELHSGKVSCAVLQMAPVPISVKIHETRYGRRQYLAAGMVPVSQKLQ